MKYLFGLLLFIHGLIHLLGFLKAFALAEIPQLIQDISRPAGVGWMLASMLFVLAAGLYVLGSGSWWWLALPAVLISQFVIILAWQDARFGTLANALISFGIVLSVAQAQFVQMEQQELKALMPSSLPPPHILTSDQLQSLPVAVQGWLQHSGVVGQPRIATVHLQQKGQMRTSPGGAWLPFKAEQFFTLDPPGFCWFAEVNMLPLVKLSGRDKYLLGKGQMLIKALGLVPVANSQGPAIDQGTLVRYLAETVWFPSAALSPDLHWQELGPHSARATLQDHGTRASAVFTFGTDGAFQSLEAQRYFDRKTGATLEKWLIQADPDSFRRFEGVQIPTRSQVTWKLQEGDFTWLKLEITSIEYNQLLPTSSERRP